MKRILRNLKPINVTTHFRGGELTFNSKSTKGFNMKDEEERALYYHWKKRYGFIIDKEVSDDEENKIT